MNVKWNLSIIITLLCANPICAQEIHAYDNWFQFRPNEDFAPSVIDMTDWLDAPAGKHGFLQMEGDALRFKNGVPVKFWGVNISSHRAYPEKKEADMWVNHLGKYGVNAVRFHKFSKYALLGTNSTSFDQEMFKKFDYFNNRLRKKGIYYGWSHIYGHKVRIADRKRLLNYDEVANLKYPWSHLNGSTSSLINFAPDLQDLSIELTVNMLNHRNPWTGLKYADDPALIFIELQNEDTIFWGAIENALEQAPTYRALLCRLFSEWLEKKYKNDSLLIKAWGKDNLKSDESLAKKNIYPSPNHRLFSRAYELAHENSMKIPQHILDKMQFLYEVQNRFYDRFEKAIRETGYKGLIIGSCWQAGMGPSHYYNLHSDYRMGPIDRHNYYGGGTGHQLKPGDVKNEPMLSLPGSGLLSVGMQQVSDRPFSLSEWMGLIPNEWVSESVPIIGIYGMGLQGWDASFHFGSDFPYFTNTLHNPGVYNVSSPTQMTFYPAVARSIYRNDIAEGESLPSRNVSIPSLAEGRLGFFEKVEQGYDNKYITGDMPAEALAIGKMGVTFTEEFVETPTVQLTNFWDKPGKKIQSNTGELLWNYGGKGCIHVNTDAFQGLVGFSAGNSHKLNDYTVEVTTPFSVILFTALEKDRTIKNSKSILLTTIARAVNSGMVYNQDKTKLLDAGEAPILLEPVDLTVKFPDNKRPKVHVLDHVGRRTGEVLKLENTTLHIKGSDTKAIYYEFEY